MCYHFILMLMFVIKAEYKVFLKQFEHMFESYDFNATWKRRLGSLGDIKRNPNPTTHFSRKC